MSSETVAFRATLNNISYISQLFPFLTFISRRHSPRGDKKLEHAEILIRLTKDQLDAINNVSEEVMGSFAREITAIQQEFNHVNSFLNVVKTARDKKSMLKRRLFSNDAMTRDVLTAAIELSGKTKHTSDNVFNMQSSMVLQTTLSAESVVSIQTGLSGIGLSFNTTPTENDASEIESVDPQLYYDDSSEQSGSVRVLRPRKSDLSTYSYHYWGSEAYFTYESKPPLGAPDRLSSQSGISIGAQATFSQCHINIFNVQSNDSSAVSDVTSNVGGISCTRHQAAVRENFSSSSADSQDAAAFQTNGASPQDAAINETYPDFEQRSSTATTQSLAGTYLGEVGIRLIIEYTRSSETQGVIRDAVFAELADAPLRLFNTHTGLLCDREAQIRAFEVSEEYKSITTLPGFDRIQKTVKKFFQYVMLSHRWEGREPQLPDIQDKNIFKLDPVHNIVKLQKFCETARQRGHRWAWSDTCCIDKHNNGEVQKSLVAMFLWYRNAALTITYLSDVSGSGSSLCGGLARSSWRTRGWILQEFLASPVVLFFKKDWTLYGDESSNHKEVSAILGEVEEATGIDRHALANFSPGSGDVRLKLQWASTRITTEEEDIAYSLMGIFDVQIPIIYGERKEKALGRLLQEVIPHSGDVAILDWVGKASGFNSCLPEDLLSFQTLPFAPPALTREERDDITCALQAAVSSDAVTRVYNQLYDLPRPRFVNRRLTLPCIIYPVAVHRREREREGSALCFSYDITATGLNDICITTLDDLTPTRSPRPQYLLVRPWSRDLLDPFFPEDRDRDRDSASESERGLGNRNLDTDTDSNSIDHAEAQAEHRAALRLLVRLSRPFSALLLVQVGAEYKRVACDGQIVAQTSCLSSARGMPNLDDIRTLDIL